MAAISSPSFVITGQAYGRRATLEIMGDTLKWRARRGARQIAENIATTVHDVRNARWLDLAWSRGGAVLVALGVLWAASTGMLCGIIAAAAGLALVVWRRVRPRQFLVLDVGDRRLVLRVTAPSASPARALAKRIQHTLASGEAPQATPMLP